MVYQKLKRAMQIIKLMKTIMHYTNLQIIRIYYMNIPSIGLYKDEQQ